MEKFVIHGGARVSGTVRVHGAKNSALPILAATVLGDSPTVLHNCPDLTDIDYAIKKIRAVNAFLCQATDEKFLFEEELNLLEEVFKD